MSFQFPGGEDHPPVTGARRVCTGPVAVICYGRRILSPLCTSGLTVPPVSLRVSFPDESARLLGIPPRAQRMRERQLAP